MIGHQEPSHIVTVRERNGQLRQVEALSIAFLPGAISGRFLTPGGVVVERIDAGRVVEVRRVTGKTAKGSACRSR